MGHVLSETGDPGAPSSILDSNNEMVLGLCRLCGKGECELEDPCIPNRIIEVVKATEGGVVSEVEYTRVVGYWAYGYWEPTLPYQGEPV